MTESAKPTLDKKEIAEKIVSKLYTKPYELMRNPCATTSYVNC